MDSKTIADLNEELNSVTSDCSFVILGNGPPSAEVNGDSQSGRFHQMLTDNSIKSMKSVEGALASLNHNPPGGRERPSDIQMQLDQLVKDNLLLKETLNQSNLAMKNQFCTLSLWYDEVVKTHESHKQKFLESQEQISKLQQENSNLKKMMEENVEACNACNGNCSPIMVNVSDEGVDVLRTKLESSEEECKLVSKTNEELSLRNKELEKRLNDVMEEKLCLEKKLEAALKNCDQLKENAMTGKCNKCQSSLGSKSSMSSLEPDISVINKLSKSIEEELQDAHKKDVISLLEKQLEEQQKIAQENKIEMEKVKIQYDELQKEKEGMQNVLQTCKVLVENLQEHGKALTAQVKIKDALLESKTQELEKIKMEIEKFVLDCEEVAILRAQMELYQNDFNEERNAREKAVGEREQMAEEVRLLKRMIKDLMKKGEMKVESSTSTDSKTAEVKNPFICAICSKRFSEAPEWESHVDDCLTFHAFP